MNPATFDPNKLSPAEIANLALTDPKLQMSGRVRRALIKSRQFRLIEPPVKLRKERKYGVSAKLDKANEKRDARRREGPGAPQKTARPYSDKVIDRLSRKTMKQLVRFVQQSARRASSAMYLAKATQGPFAAAAGEEQNRQLALMRAGLRMIQMRTNPPISNEV